MDVLFNELLVKLKNSKNQLESTSIREQITPSTTNQKHSLTFAQIRELDPNFTRLEYRRYIKGC